jgi:hypothetical protein
MVALIKRSAVETGKAKDEAGKAKDKHISDLQLARDDEKARNDKKDARSDEELARALAIIDALKTDLYAEKKKTEGYLEVIVIKENLRVKNQALEKDLSVARKELSDAQARNEHDDEFFDHFNKYYLKGEMVRLHQSLRNHCQQGGSPDDFQHRKKPLKTCDKCDKKYMKVHNKCNPKKRKR